MAFKAQIWPTVSGVIVTWKIKDLPDSIETPADIPENYDLIRAKKAAQKVGVVIIENCNQNPKIKNIDKLKTAVFKIEKMDPDTFKVLDYVGELESISRCFKVIQQLTVLDDIGIQ